MDSTALILSSVALPIFSVILNSLLPIVSEVLPINKEILHVQDFDLPYNSSYQYPVLDFVGLVKRYGYTAEEYILISADGYILKLHRISNSPKSKKSANKPVVYIQHGILLSSDSWVLNGPDTDLAFLLADAGYDVWVGNVRGNTYSQTHANKSMPKTDFWKFSYHEMAIFDLRTFVDFILKTTNQPNLTYIGYSMGTTISYVFLSMLPEYNAKIKEVYSLAPVVYWDYSLRSIPAILNNFYWLINIIVDYFKVLQVMPQSALAAFIGDTWCRNEDVSTQPLCVQFISNFGLDPIRMNKTALPDILAHFPAGTSMLNVNHYHQNYLRETFQAFDHGPKENLKRYNQLTPPIYNLSKVVAPVHLWYARNDDIVNYRDVHTLKENLPNVKSYVQVDYKKFNHLDFLWATDVKELVYDRLMKSMKSCK